MMTKHKKKNTKFKYSMEVTILIIGLMVIGFLWYGGKEGWIALNITGAGGGSNGNTGSTGFVGGTGSGIAINNLDEAINSDMCSLSFDENNICAGDNVRGSIKSLKNTNCYVFGNDGTGWKFVYQGRTNSNGILSERNTFDMVGNFNFRAVCDINNNGVFDLLIDCVTNQVQLNVIDCDSSTPPTYDVGDSVGGATGSGSLIGNVGGIVNIDLSGVATGGNCRLGAKIKTMWDYRDIQSCYNMQESQNVLWTLYDSSGSVLSYTDYFPQTRENDLCPLNWDGMTNWKLTIDPLLNIGDECIIDYSYIVDVYVCECN